jgi:phosphoadenosine phosphosulfate reductase
MLIENTLFGICDKIKTAITCIQDIEHQALAMSNDGYFLADSGGKDSSVVRDLIRKAEAKHTANYNFTTVDPPELVRFIRQCHPDTVISRPEKTMYQLIIQKMMPPTRKMRYCCAHLKERGGKKHIIITGVRALESQRRSKRRLIETCLRDSKKIYFNPIIDWSTEEVWEYIRLNNIPYCSLYDEGFTRLGCVGCPLTNRVQREKEFMRWPHYERMYRRAFDIAVQRKKELGRKYLGLFPEWKTGEQMFDWWMSDSREFEDESQGMLF